jgi:hypothetical protein
MMIRLPLLALLLLAGVCPADVLFEDDFDDGDASGWHEISMVEYDVIEGMYRMYGGYEQNHGISFNGDLEGTMSVPDYSAVCTVLPETGTFFGMMVRFREDAAANIMLVLSLPQQTVVLYRWNWTGITLLDQAPFEVLQGTEYRIRFETVGEVFRGKAWTGEEEPAEWMVSASDTLAAPGSVALFCAGISDVSLSCLFDDVVVTGSPSPLESVSWGAVKALAGAYSRGYAERCGPVIFPPL